MWDLNSELWDMYSEIRDVKKQQQQKNYEIWTHNFKKKTELWNKNLQLTFLVAGKKNYLEKKKIWF